MPQMTKTNRTCTHILVIIPKIQKLMKKKHTYKWELNKEFDVIEREREKDVIQYINAFDNHT